MVIPKFIKDLKSLLYKDIIKRDKFTPFLIFISILISFGLARLSVLVFPGNSLFIKDYQIHHFFYGIGLIAISNWIALVTNKESMFKFSAVLFGLGLGQVIDEFGLILTCTTPGFICNYWSRPSYDALVFIGSILLTIIYSGPFFRALKKYVIKLNGHASKIKNILMNNGREKS